VRLHVVLCIIYFFYNFACYGAQDKSFTGYRRTLSSQNIETYVDMTSLRSVLVPNVQALAERDKLESTVDKLDPGQLISVEGIKDFNAYQYHTNTIQLLMHQVMQQALVDVAKVECASKEDLLRYTKWQRCALGELHRWIGVVLYKKVKSTLADYAKQCVLQLQQDRQGIETHLEQLALQRWKSNLVHAGYLLGVSGLIGCTYRSELSMFKKIRNTLLGVTAMGVFLEKHRRCLQKIDADKKQVELRLQKNSEIQKQLKNDELLTMQVQDLFLPILQESRSNLNVAISGYESRELQRLNRERVIRQKQIDQAQQEELRRKKTEKQEKMLLQQQEDQQRRKESAELVKCPGVDPAGTLQRNNSMKKVVMMVVDTGKSLLTKMMPVLSLLRGKQEDPTGSQQD